MDVVYFVIIQIIVILLVYRKGVMSFMSSLTKSKKKTLKPHRKNPDIVNWNVGDKLREREFRNGQLTHSSSVGWRYFIGFVKNGNKMVVSKKIFPDMTLPENAFPQNNVPENPEGFLDPCFDGLTDNEIAEKMRDSVGIELVETFVSSSNHSIVWANVDASMRDDPTEKPLLDQVKDSPYQTFLNELKKTQSSKSEQLL